MKQEYVTGFLFDERKMEVVLIRKNKPKWQEGKYNGVGGKVEAFDASLEAAMEREFREETGLTITTWERFCSLEGDWGVVHFFRAFTDWDTFKTVRTTTDEKVIRASRLMFQTRNMVWSEEDGEYYHIDTIPNLKWLIPMALSMDADRASSFVIQEVVAA